jgi:rhodanese-related sulfurtransferase
VFRKLLGREPTWTEQWDVFPGGADDRLAMFNVDLGAVEAAPVPKLPMRVDVEFSYAGDGASGMPAEAELVEIHTLEDVVDKAMRALGGAYVGRVLSGNTGRMTGYAPPGAVAPQLPAHPGLSPRLTLTADPAWSVVRDVLAPDEWQRNMIDDNRVIQALTDHGDRLGEPRDIEYVAYFPAADDAQAAAAQLRAEGFIVGFERDDEGEYALQAMRRDPVEAPDVHAVTWLVRQAVEQHAGVYDGWGCTVQG